MRLSKNQLQFLRRKQRSLPPYQPQKSNIYYNSGKVNSFSLTGIFVFGGT